MSDFNVVTILARTDDARMLVEGERKVCLMRQPRAFEYYFRAEIL
jgi:hypothetical protein